MIFAPGGVVVCSSCGYDNAAGMRFCGMCGTPLPHLPITAPGAHSTLNFTRVPVENRVSTHEQSTSSQDRGGVLLQMPPASPTAEPINPEAPVEADLRDEAPAELVPDVPLHDYVQRFHYEPPSEPDEVTMRGETHQSAHEDAGVADSEPEPITPVDNILASSNAGEVNPPTAVSTADAEDVDNRLGLEPETPAESRIERPRFLDINPPVQASRPPANSGTSTIAGPSFLGLNDAPQTWPEALGVEPGTYAPRNTHWRLWLALIAFLVVGWLGYLEWQSQTNRTDNGPVEVIRAKVRGLGLGAGLQSSQSSPATTPDNSDSKPQMQVMEQPKPKEQPDSKPQVNVDAASNATAQPNPPATAATTARDQNAPPPSPSSVTPAPATPSENTTAAAKPVSKSQPPPPPVKAKANREGDAIDQEVTTKQFAPGADEMSKANNASDAAAEAAWLWKATAKGNPDAPVQLADMYIKGEGVPRSCEQAMVLLKSAATKENAHARNRLASMYATGNCVQRNRVEAYRWVSAALNANPRSEWAQQNRDLLWEQMTPDERIMARKYR